MFAILGAVLLPSACATSPPHDRASACAIFQSRANWWDAALDSQRRWGAPPELQLAIINAESSFDSDARPPRRGGFLFLPGRRPSSAFGYAQAIDGTWDWYREETGRRGASRDNFRDAVDFIGWYAARSQRVSGIGLTDARNQYLAYHEGHAGYNRGSYAGRSWLIRRAGEVEALSQRYRTELAGCRDRLNRGFRLF